MLPWNILTSSTANFFGGGVGGGMWDVEGQTQLQSKRLRVVHDQVLLREPLDAPCCYLTQWVLMITSSN